MGNFYFSAMIFHRNLLCFSARLSEKRDGSADQPS
jgi:hypothetical protein